MGAGCSINKPPVSPEQIEIHATVGKTEIVDSIKRMEVSPIQHLTVLKILQDVRNESRHSSGSGGSDCGSGRFSASKRQTVLELHKCRLRIRKLRCELDTERDIVDDLLIDITDSLDRIK